MKNLRLLPLPAALLLAACIQCRSPKAAAPEPPRTTTPDSPASITSVAAVEMGTVAEVLNLSGRVAFDPENVVAMLPTLGGRVLDVRVELGDFVQKGDTLAVVKSSEAADYEKQRREAELQLRVAQKNMDAAGDMGRAGLLSSRDVLAAEKELENAKAEWKKIGDVFEIYNMGNDATYTLCAPVSGFVVQKSIARNVQLRSDGSTELFTISGLGSVWVLADVYESDISRVSVGCPASITTPAYPNRTFYGTVDKVYNVLNSESKTMTARITLRNEDYLLKPGMFAGIRVRCSGGKAATPCVPAQALVFDSGRQYAVVVAPDSTLSIREVLTGEAVDGTAPVAAGLEAGERVVVRNVLLVYDSLKHP